MRRSDPCAAGAVKAARRAPALIPESLGPEGSEAWREVCELLARFAGERLADGATARSSGQFDRLNRTGRFLPHAAGTYDIAVRAYGRIGDPAAQSRLLTELARESFDPGDRTRAVSCQGRAARIAETIGDEVSRGEALSTMHTRICCSRTTGTPPGSPSGPPLSSRTRTARPPPGAPSPPWPTPTTV
ncbi:hypothetical protein [Streptomyces zaomyceticus]|uniref:hypothetical protein n=1 Tax=Streptomyces zaomyceticus TaxID=68286 RepID=UPI00341E91B0